MDDSAFMTAHLHRCHRFSASNVILAGATLQIVRVVVRRWWWPERGVAVGVVEGVALADGEVAEFVR